jgi:hypothetical protein
MERVPEINPYEPGQIYIFKLYRCEPEELARSLEKLAEDESFPKVRFSLARSPGLYVVEYHGEEPDADDCVRIVNGPGSKVKLQVWAARQASLVEMILLKNKISYDAGVIGMPLQQAFHKAAHPMSLEKCPELRTVRYKSARRSPVKRR